MFIVVPAPEHEFAYGIPTTGLKPDYFLVSSMSYLAVDDLLADLRRLCEPGVLGFYSQFEVTEVIGMPNGQDPFNVLTVLVAEEHASPKTPDFIGDRISVPKLKGVKFGLVRYTRTLPEVFSAVRRLAQGEHWALSGLPLKLSRGCGIPPVLAPADSFRTVPMNAILKNNFWDGSYVLELFDEAKDLVSDLLTSPPRLMALAEAVSSRVPLRIAGLSDRLGNVVFQLPIDIVRSRLSHLSDGIDFEIAWHPRATPRELEVHATAHRDHLITGQSIVRLDGERTRLPLQSVQDPYLVNVWDPRHGILLSASGEQVRLQQMTFGLGVTGAAERLMTLPDEGEHRVPVTYVQPSTTLGTAREHQRWTLDRLYSEEASGLARSRRFRQYNAAGPAASAHADAVDDLRHLIRQYGRHGVWLWDPYLSARDILQTLFFNPYAGAPMRALASARKASGLDGQANLHWIATQRAGLSNCHSNYHGLELEYRALNGNAGWDFHDRFLIFPNVDGRTLAWSLGISVNQAGDSHHILQQVDNGRLVAEAFDQLWNALGSEQVVWKWPMRLRPAAKKSQGTSVTAA